MNDTISDKRFTFLILGFSLFIIFLFGMMISVLTESAWVSISQFGINFSFQSDWNPLMESYGALTFIYGTVLTSLLALVFAVPSCLSLALVTTELCHHRLRGVIAFLIEMLAAIPSIVYGLWALFVLAPWIKSSLFPLVEHYLPGWFFLEGPSFGLGILASSLVLAIMISPIITTVVIEVFKAVPPAQRYAALALGATRWEMMKIALLRPGAKGILGAIILGLGRALGETMAVAMVIGNNPEIASSLFGAGATMASVIANEYAEAVDDLHLSSLAYIALLLFVITLLVNTLARLLVKETKGIQS
jgi:phosphate transport system permease protein